MKAKWWIILSLVIVLVVGSIGCVPGGGQQVISVSTQQSTGIWVTGRGEVMVVPDIAMLTLGIEAQEEDVATAQAEASAAMDSVMQALTGQDIASEDIQTVYFNITEVTRWDNVTDTQEVIDYRVTNTVSVKVREVEKAGEVIDAVVAAGGNMIRINSITFTVDDPQPYYEQARELAIGYAKAKAEQLASETGISLGNVTYISESSYSYSSNYRVYGMEDAIAIPAPTVVAPISVGQLEITATVQIAYDIVQ